MVLAKMILHCAYEHNSMKAAFHTNDKKNSPALINLEIALSQTSPGFYVSAVQVF